MAVFFFVVVVFFFVVVFLVTVSLSSPLSLSKVSYVIVSNAFFKKTLLGYVNLT